MNSILTRLPAVPLLDHPQDNTGDVSPALLAEKAARNAGYQALAGPYTGPQRWMVRRVLADLQHDPEVGICLVKKSRGVEIWIKPSPRQEDLTRRLMPSILHSYLRPTLPKTATRL